MAHDAANRQRVFQSTAKRNCFPRGDSSAAVFRPERRRCCELRRDWSRYRPRNHAWLRRQGPGIRCRGQPQRLVDGERCEGVRWARAESSRSIWQLRSAARFESERQANARRNIADLGGTSIAYEALQRALAKDPSRRKNIDGFTPEQRFFLSLAQLWRTNWREAELRRRITVDPHSPGQFRAIGPHVNLPEFYDAFGIKETAPMWRPPELRAKIW